MENKRSEILKYALTALIAVTIALISVSIFTVLSLSVDELIDVVSQGKIDFSYIALLIISALMLGASVWCFSQWNARRSYIYVSHAHQEVIPVDRREEYLELSL